MIKLNSYNLMMPLVILYEIDGEPASDHVNAMIIPNIDSSKEIYLIDIISYIHSSNKRNKHQLHHFCCYAVLEDQLIWISSPSSLVPIGNDQCIRILFKLANTPPFILIKQSYQLSDKSRSKYYSTEDYIKSKAYAFETFKECYSFRNVSTVEKQSSISLSTQHHSIHSSNHNRQHANTHNNDSSAMSLNNIVGDDAATTITEVASIAAKNLFQFANNVSKSVFDMTNSIATPNSTDSQQQQSMIYKGLIMKIGSKTIQVNRLVAEGGFGMVYLVEDMNTPSSSVRAQYALKQIICQSIEQYKEAKHEIHTLEQFNNSPYIIELLSHNGDSANNNNNNRPISNINPCSVSLLFPWYSDGTLWDKIDYSLANTTCSNASISQEWPFSEYIALHIVMNAAKALLTLHREGIAHRDVKPHNFMIRYSSANNCNSFSSKPSEIERKLSSNSIIMPILMDLGSTSKAVVEIKTKRDANILEEEAAWKTSAAYRSPELTSPSSITSFFPFTIDERVDSWGLGCCMYAIAFGHSPFENTREGVLKLAILNGRYQIPSQSKHRDCTYSNGYIKLIDYLLQVDITKRPFMDEVIHICKQLLN